MDTHKLKMKIGPHEFEAEGTQDAVEKQFEAFKELVKSNPPAPDPAPYPKIVEKKNGGAGEDLNLDTIIKIDGEKASLTAHPSGQDPQGEAVLLILLGHKVLRAAEQVSGILLLGGMTQSGFQIDRVDRTVASLPAGEVMRTGAKKGVKYRLTNSGVTHARAIASTLIATLT